LSSGSDNQPSFSAQGKVLRIISEVAVYLFPIVVLLTGIPVFSIIVRYNLLQSGLCNKGMLFLSGGGEKKSHTHTPTHLLFLLCAVWANIFAIIFPWIVSVIFYTGKGLINISMSFELGSPFFILSKNRLQSTGPA
jgi:hypothetical protein